MNPFYSCGRTLIAFFFFLFNLVCVYGIDFHPIKFLEKKEDSFATSVTPDGLWIAGHSGGDPFIYHIETHTMQPLWYTTSHLQSKCLEILQIHYGDSFGNFTKRNLDLSGNDLDPCRGNVCISKDATVVRWITRSGKLFCWKPDTGIEKCRPIGTVHKLVMSSSSDGGTYGYGTSAKKKIKDEVTTRWNLTSICHDQDESEDVILPAYTAEFSPAKPKEMILNGLSADGELGVGIMYLGKTKGIIHRKRDVPRITPIIFSSTPKSTLDSNPNDFEWDMSKTYHLDNILVHGNPHYPFAEESLKNIQDYPTQTVFFGVSPNKKYAVGAMKFYFSFDENSPLCQKKQMQLIMDKNRDTFNHKKYGAYIHFLFIYDLENKKFQFLANSLDYSFLAEPCYELKISDDGKTIIGTYQKPDVEIEGESHYKQTQNFLEENECAWTKGQAIIWTKEDGLYLLKEWLIKKNVYINEFKNWDLLAATDLTPDGRFFVGYGKNPYDHIQGFHISK